MADAGLGLVRVVCQAAAGSWQLPSIRARRCGGIHLKLSPYTIYEHVFYLFIYFQKTINFGREEISYSSLQASLYCLSKAKPFKLLLHIFMSGFGTCKRASYFLS